jgi:hypothetical protein
MMKSLLAASALVSSFGLPLAAQAQTVEQRLADISCDEIEYGPGTSSATAAPPQPHFYGRSRIGADRQILCTVRSNPEANDAIISIAEQMTLGGAPGILEHAENRIALKIQRGTTPSGDSIWGVPIVTCSLVGKSALCNALPTNTEAFYLSASWNDGQLTNLKFGTKIMTVDKPWNLFRGHNREKQMLLATNEKRLSLYGARGLDQGGEVAARFESNPQETVNFLTDLLGKTDKVAAEVVFDIGKDGNQELRALKTDTNQIRTIWQIMSAMAGQLTPKSS